MSQAGVAVCVQRGYAKPTYVRENYNVRAWPGLEQVGDDVLTFEQVCSKINGYRRGDVPLAATKLTMFIDVHDKLLFYVVAAWEQDFTAYIVDYGTYPDQKRLRSTMRDATRTLGRAAPGAGKEGAVQAGIEKLTGEFLSRDWRPKRSSAVLARSPPTIRRLSTRCCASTARRSSQSTSRQWAGCRLRRRRRPAAREARR